MKKVRVTSTPEAIDVHELRVPVHTVWIQGGLYAVALIAEYASEIVVMTSPGIAEVVREAMIRWPWLAKHMWEMDSAISIILWPDENGQEESPPRDPYI